MQRIVKINKLQAAILALLSFIIVIIKISKPEWTILYYAFIYTGMLAFVIFAPSLMNIGINKKIVEIITYTPLLLLGFLGDSRDYYILSIPLIYYGIMVGIIFLVMNSQYFKQVLKTNTKIISTPLSNKKAIINICITIFIIACEESFFRCFLSDISPVIVAFLFFLYHFASRDSHAFSIKSYIYQFILSFALSLVFSYTKNFYVVFIAHLFYDIPFLFTFYFRTKIIKNSFTFED